MLIAEGSAHETYLQAFENSIATLATDPIINPAGRLVADFFAQNAVDFLGLRRGSPTRNRLDQFYNARGIAEPTWLKKVDRSLPGS